MSKKKRKKRTNENVNTEMAKNEIEDSEQMTDEDPEAEETESEETEPEETESEETEAEETEAEGAETEESETEGSEEAESSYDRGTPTDDTDETGSQEEEAAAEEESVPGESNPEKKAGETGNTGNAARASAKEELAKAQKSALKSHKERTEENEKAKENDARREARHKRRIRNQVISYVAVFLFLAIVLGGGYFIFRYVSSKFAKPVKEQPVTVEAEAPVDEQIEEQIEAIIGEEEEIAPPEIEEDQIIEEPEVTEEPEVDPLEEYIDGIISGMTLEDKVAGIIMTSPEALTGVNRATLAGDGTRAALEKYKVGGIVYSPENVTAHDQFRDMIAGTLEMLQTPTFIAFPEEGGAGSILAKDGFYDAVSAPADTSATGEVINAYNNGKAIAEALGEIGINVDLAPVADITLEEGNVIDKYSYGADPYMVSGYINSMVSGLEDGGVSACIKYFPGLGSVTVDPAKGRAITERTEMEFRSGEFPVYIAAIEGGVKMIMMSNAVVTAFDDSCPASLSSKVVTDLLRDEFGFKGVIISGNLSDVAIKDYYGAGEAAVMALKAGCDMVQNPDNFEEAYNAIIEAVGQGVISEERINDCLRRIYRIKYAGSV